jgi:hypothetical protein
MTEDNMKTSSTKNTAFFVFIVIHILPIQQIKKFSTVHLKPQGVKKRNNKQTEYKS